MKNKLDGINVLVTAVGGDIGRKICFIIKEVYPQFTIIGTDSRVIKDSSNYVDKFIKISNASQRGYIAQLNKIIEDNKITFVYPNNEDEIKKIIDKSSKLKSHIFAHTGKKVFDLSYDKFVTAKKLESINISVPWTMKSYNSIPNNFPCILKKRVGSGSKDVEIIKNMNDAKKQIGKKNFIFQELLKPKSKEITCAVYRDKRGRTYSLIMLRRLKKGYTKYIKIIENKQISDLCRKIAVEFKLTGSMNIQLILTKTGPRIFEINPRYSSTVLMRHMLGFSDLVWSINERLGKKIQYKKISENIRAYIVKDKIVIR